jgi:hypothetical protein
MGTRLALKIKKTFYRLNLRAGAVSGKPDLEWN